MTYLDEIQQAVLALANFTEQLAHVPSEAVSARKNGGHIEVTIDYRKSQSDYKDHHGSARRMLAALGKSQFLVDVTDHKVIPDGGSYRVIMPEITLRIPDTLDSVTQFANITRKTAVNYAEDDALGFLSSLSHLVEKIDKLPAEQAGRIKAELLARASQELGVGQDKPR